jgi:acylphosphatase
VNKCLRISFDAKVPFEFLRGPVQKEAQALSLEGIAQILSSAQKVLIVVSGKKSNIDNFVDFLHKELAEYAIQGIEVEPFVKVKDYRGVFRVIE